MKYRLKILSFCVVLLYLLLLVHHDQVKLTNQFKWDKLQWKNLKKVLPTTSHIDSLNLKTLTFETNLNSKKTLDNNNLFDLREQLIMQFPYEPEKSIPRNIWQTWKNGPNDKNFESQLRTFNKHWLDVDSKDWHYSLILDDQMLPFLKELYGSVPLIIEAFELMPAIILKADFFRYLILYARGGIYSDMDTFPLKNLNELPSIDQTFLDKIYSGTEAVNYGNLNVKYNSNVKNVDKGNNKNNKSKKINEPGFIVGIEADPDRPDWHDWYARRIQFCQWTIQSKPGHPILRELILNITSTTLNSVNSDKLNIYKGLIELDNVDDYNVNFRDKRFHDTKYPHKQKKTRKNVDGSDIMNWTGPGIFSDVIFEYLNNLITTNDDILIINDNLGVDDTWKDDGSLKSTRKFFDIVVNSLSKFNKIPWEFFSLITKPVIVDDIMVLPITSFSPGIRTMEAGEDNDEMAFVKHVFAGSWKKKADENAIN